jgi:hypothetical protein
MFNREDYKSEVFLTEEVADMHDNSMNRQHNILNTQHVDFNKDKFDWPRVVALFQLSVNAL